MNQFTIVGRLTKDVEIKELENGKKVCNITLAIPRLYKNEEGVYETDFIDCVLWNGIATNISEYCKKGDMIGVRGHMASRIDKNDKYIMEIIAEKVTFLSARKDFDKEMIEENIKI